MLKNLAIAALVLSILLPVTARAADNDISVVAGDNTTVEINVIESEPRDRYEDWDRDPQVLLPVGYRCVTPGVVWSWLVMPLPLGSDCFTATPMGPVFGFVAP